MHIQYIDKATGEVVKEEARGHFPQVHWHWIHDDIMYVVVGIHDHGDGLRIQLCRVEQSPEPRIGELPEVTAIGRMKAGEDPAAVFQDYGWDWPNSS